MGPREPQKLLQANRSTEIGLVTQRIINYGYLSVDGFDPNSLNLLLAAKQIENLLRSGGHTWFIEGAVISDRLGDNEAGMRSTLKEAGSSKGSPLTRTVSSR